MLEYDKSITVWELIIGVAVKEAALFSVRLHSICKPLIL